MQYKLWEQVDRESFCPRMEAVSYTHLDCAIAGDGFFLLGDKQGVSVDNLDSLKLSRVGNLDVYKRQGLPC